MLMVAGTATNNLLKHCRRRSSSSVLLSTFKSPLRHCSRCDRIGSEWQAATRRHVPGLWASLKGAAHIWPEHPRLQKVSSSAAEVPPGCARLYPNSLLVFSTLCLFAAPCWDIMSQWCMGVPSRPCKRLPILTAPYDAVLILKRVEQTDTLQFTSKFAQGGPWEMGGVPTFLFAAFWMNSCADIQGFSDANWAKLWCITLALIY